MAKGDHKRMQDEIGKQSNLTQYGYGGSAPVAAKFKGSRQISAGSPGVVGSGGMQNLTSNLYDANKQFTSNYNTGVEKNLRSYDDIMNSYQQFLGRGSGNAATSAAIGGFSDMANTGGLSEQDKMDMRARAIAPTRSIYDRGQQEVSRQRSLQGGYSPNATAALAKMSREQSYNISDINTNVNAGIAEMVARNKLAGLSGLGSVGSELSGQDIQAQLGAMGGMSNLYGTSPGLAGMFGDQVLSSQNNLLQGQGLQNNLSQILMNARSQNAQIPGNFQQAMGNINSVVGLGSRIAGGLVGLGGFGSGIPGYGGNDPAGVQRQIYGRG